MTVGSDSAAELCHRGGGTCSDSGRHGRLPDAAGGREFK
jgi:hypothetical protein